MNDEKYYLNILETLPDGKFRHYLTVGFGRKTSDFYIFDPRLKREVHISHHSGVNIHIKRGSGKSNKLHLFNNPWIDNPESGKLKQAIYFRPSAFEDYPLLDVPPQTPRTENICFKNNFAPGVEISKYPNIVYKILLGPASKTGIYYKDFHDFPGTTLDTVSNDIWTVGTTCVRLDDRVETDVGTFIWIFNTNEDIHDRDIFAAPVELEGKQVLKPFFVITQNFPQGEVALIYYEIR